MSTKAERAAAVADVEWAIEHAEDAAERMYGAPSTMTPAHRAEIGVAAGRVAAMLLSRLPPPCLRSDEP